MCVGDICKVSIGFQWAACVLPVMSRWYCMVRELSASTDWPHPTVEVLLVQLYVISIGCGWWWHAWRHLQHLTLWQLYHRQIIYSFCLSSIGWCISWIIWLFYSYAHIDTLRWKASAVEGEAQRVSSSHRVGGAIRGRDKEEESTRVIWIATCFVKTVTSSYLFPGFHRHPSFLSLFFILSLSSHFFSSLISLTQSIVEMSEQDKMFLQNFLFIFICFFFSFTRCIEMLLTGETLIFHLISRHPQWQAVDWTIILSWLVISWWWTLPSCWEQVDFVIRSMKWRVSDEFHDSHSATRRRCTICYLKKKKPEQC